MDKAEPGTPLAGRRRPARRGADTHYLHAKAELAQLIVELAGKGLDRLPAEDRLSERLGFSRPTIRSALLALEKEGKIQRLHGIGTLINRHALEISANLAEDKPFVEVIAESGYEPTVDILRLEEGELPKSVMARLGVPAGTQGCLIRRLFRASGAPAVYSQDFFPRAWLTAPLSELTAEVSTFAFVRRWTAHNVRYSVTELTAATADATVSEVLALDVGTAVLKLDLLHITQEDQRIGETHAYINDSVLRFGLVRSHTLS